MEYIDCPWFIDFLLQEVAQLSANREKIVSAICFGTFEAYNFCTPRTHSFFFVCVSAASMFLLCVCVYVDLSVGGAAVSTDDGVHNIKKKGGGRGRTGDREKR